MVKVRPHPTTPLLHTETLTQCPVPSMGVFPLKSGAHGRWVGPGRTQYKSWKKCQPQHLTEFKILLNYSPVPWATLSSPVIQSTKDGLHKVPRSHGQAWELLIGTLWGWALQFSGAVCDARLFVPHQMPESFSTYLCQTTLLLWSAVLC